jgi:hypothetical protein
MLEVVFQIIKSLLLLYSLVYFCEAMQFAEKGATFSTSFTMNLLSAAMWPVNFCTSFLVCGGCIWMIDVILSVVLDTFSGDQAAQYLASCYPENTLLHVEFEVGLVHIGEGLR